MAGFNPQTDIRSTKRILTSERDHSTETAEDYVEMIAEVLRGQETCRITGLAMRFGVSHVTVHRIVERLQTEGLS